MAININELFIKATRQKLRFPFKGMATVEDLWDMNVRDLDTVFKTLNSQKKQNDEESLLTTKSKEASILEEKIEIVKFIVGFKQAEANQKRIRAEKNAQKNRIAEILADKRDEELRGKSVEELKNMLDALDD